MMALPRPPHVCDESGETRHVVEDCPYTHALEEVKYVGGNGANYDPYSNTFNQGWRNDPNFSWKE